MTEERIEKEIMFFNEAWINGNRKYVVAALFNRIKEDIRQDFVMIFQYQTR